MSEFDRNKWDTQYTAATDEMASPSEVLVGLADLIPTGGRALDLAGGLGRHAIWLAQRGLNVTIADVSEVGLKRATDFATRAGVHVNPLRLDFDEQPLPAGPWDLILSVCFLDRTLFSQFPDMLASGGQLIVIQPTKRNLERHEKPPADFLLDDGELPSLIQGLDHIKYEEGWLADGRHDAVVVAARSELLEAIAGAFADCAYPGDDHLTVYDRAGWEYDETRKLLRGKTWQEMPVHEFLSGDTPIPDLTPNAFHYFLPALLIESFGHDVHDVAGSLTFYLSPSSAKCDEKPYDYDATDEYNERLSRFTPDQLDVIIRVLQEYKRRGWQSATDTDSAINRLRREMNK